MRDTDVCLFGRKLSKRSGVIDRAVLLAARTGLSVPGFTLACIEPDDAVIPLDIIIIHNTRFRGLCSGLSMLYEQSG